MDSLLARILLFIMPTYSYVCDDCKTSFELFFTIKEYVSQPKCSFCNSKHTSRNYSIDFATISNSIKKSDAELATIGDLAKRNSDKMSDDEKTALYLKHNSYKENTGKELPKGMSRVKKPPKTLWPGAKPRIKRKPNGK